MSTDPQIQSAAPSVLFHPDLHKRNVFVSEDDPSIVTGIIDWQSASIESTFWYADDVPDFTVLTEPGGLCAKTFEVCSQFRPFRYSYRTWRDGAMALRHELIEISRSWKELRDIFDGMLSAILTNVDLDYEEPLKTKGPKINPAKEVEPR
ncbi:hypothetical protein EMCG_05875 [[Emmonsia] crescens]|uniref:Altered inheritance of mitochondria protein 9, mitochondrial n=1 Tax=[Emmonsia] crescens TaxID=73230 RepID=A0A0G2ID39_9EURO|nr:hypothetical protein EMCG_05875 [Emmonsia crescens UAMH 3008]